MKANKLILLALLLMTSIVAQAQLPSAQLKDLKGKTINTAKLSNDGKPFINSII
jgi:hypothetical protein